MAQAKECAGCGTVTAGELPAHARARASYGPETCAQAANLAVGHHIPIHRATLLLCQLAWHRGLDRVDGGDPREGSRIPERLYQVIEQCQARRWTGSPPGTDTAPRGPSAPGWRCSPAPTVTRRHRLADPPVVLQPVPALGRRPGSRPLRAAQARHTLATSLLRHGATLTHIRRYLGQVSDRMAEHYVHLSHSDLEDVLQHVWVAGPGAARPGELISGLAVPLSRKQAQALAIDLSREPVIDIAHAPALRRQGGDPGFTVTPGVMTGFRIRP